MIFFKKNKHGQEEKNGPARKTCVPDGAKNQKITMSPEENVTFVENLLGKDIGIIVRRLTAFKERVPFCLMYIGPLTDIKTVGEQIVEPLLKDSSDAGLNRGDTLEAIKARVSFSSGITVTDQMDAVLSGLLGGSAVLFAREENRALIFDCGKAKHRDVEKPENEAAMLGSRDSLTEDLDVNCNLIIKRLKSPDLKVQKFIAGKLSQTELKLMWIEGVAASDAVGEIRNRINKIDIDNVDGIGALSELIRDRPLSIFPTYKQTERPDVIVRCLTDGQFAVLCDNSPYAFVAPVSFLDQFKTADDYARDTFASSYLRLVRFLAFVLCTTISALYLACVAYNHNIVPPELAIDIAVGRHGVPFPSIIEILLLTVMISLIQEASLRIPGPIGYFIGTMSAIVIGEATVTAGYVSASVIIVISVSVVSSFAVSSSVLLYTTRLINYFLILLAGFFGMYGIICGVVIISWHMVSLSSFGLPYLYPVIPFDGEAVKDTLIRAPMRTLKKRFGLLAPTNRTRLAEQENKAAKE